MGQLFSVKDRCPVKGNRIDATEELIAYDVQLGPGYRVSYEQQDEEWQAYNRLYMVVYRPEQGTVVTDMVGEEEVGETTRKPPLSQAVPGRPLRRTAQRALPLGPLNAPPRITRRTSRPASRLSRPSAAS